MRLTKHHGLGNDFLVLVDLDDAHPIDADLAVAVCDRHRGVGADGLIRVTRGTVEPYAMELRNEDGSRAEMSGNGISCLAQAVLLAGAAEPELRVETDAGLRIVTVVATETPYRHRMRVAMGTPVLGERLVEWEDAGVLRAVAVDVGNPHVVCHVPDADLGPDLVVFGRRIDEATPGGANVELVMPGAPADAAPAGGDGTGAVTMVVYERGVGPTQACGTGAVATAVAARDWGLVSRTATVHQPGGAAIVELPETPGGPAHLTVPVVAVATVDWLA